MRALLPVLAACLLCFAGPARAATEADCVPAALVEAVEAAGVTDLGFMDLLCEGREIVLGESGRLTLSYLSSCRIEEIAGGTVTVGQDRSQVVSPTPVVVDQVDCDGGGIVPTQRQGEEAAGLTFRRVAPSGEPPVRVYATMPVFLFREPVEELLIEPVNAGMGQSYRLAVEGRRLDLAEQGVALEPGALYTATAAGKTVKVRVAKHASQRARSVVERLITF